MPTEITITAYEFNELTGKARDTAATKLSEWVTGHAWWEDIYEEAKEEGKAHGFDIEDIQFSGFWSQGDGASWTGMIDLMPFIEKHADNKSASFGEDMILVELMRNEWLDKLIAVSRRSFHYVHEHTMRCDFVGEYDIDPDYIAQHMEAKLVDGVMAGASVVQLFDSFAWSVRLQEWVTRASDKAKEFAGDIYIRLEKEYDALTDHDNLAEFAKLNNYLFDENGRPI